MVGDAEMPIWEYRVSGPIKRSMPTAANGRARISKRTLTAVGGEHDDPAAQEALAPEERIEHGIGRVRVECREAVVEERYTAAGVHRASEGLRHGLSARITTTNEI